MGQRQNLSQTEKTKKNLSTWGQGSGTICCSQGRTGYTGCFAWRGLDEGGYIHARLFKGANRDCWIERSGDTDTARRVLLRVTAVYIDRTKPSRTGFSHLFCQSHMWYLALLARPSLLLTWHPTYATQCERLCNPGDRWLDVYAVLCATNKSIVGRFKRLGSTHGPGVGARCGSGELFSFPSLFISLLFPFRFSFGEACRSA